MFKKYQEIHFVGIGGSGMSGIAEVLLTLGYRVSGSDLKITETTKRLNSLGATIYRGHDTNNVKNAHVVVVSSAVSQENPEVKAAFERNIPVVPRAEMLAELMRLKWSIAIAGSHGKTSTTAMIASLLEAAELDPTMVIGGRINSMNSNAKLGKGNFLVAEADESDRSFLKLTPSIGVITNIDPEHMEQYRDFEHLKDAFVAFANKVPFYGSVVVCSDHPVVKELLPRFERRVITYGFCDADYTASNIEQKADRLRFEVYYQKEFLGEVAVNMVGKHYVLNALASIATARELDVSFADIAKGLREFQGVARRFQIIHRESPVVVDDYAHHPVEISATLSAAKLGWPKKHLVAVVQPHRYSRLKDHFNGFVDSLVDADSIVVMDVYAAGEKASAKYTGEQLCQSLIKKYPGKKIVHAPKTAQVLQNLQPMCRPQNLVMFLGAGDVTQTARNFRETLTSRV